MSSDDDQLIDSGEDFDTKKIAAVPEEIEEPVEEDATGLGDVEDIYDAMDKEDEDPYLEMQSLMDPYGITGNSY